MIWWLAASVLLVSLLSFVYYLKKRNEYFVNLGIPGPKPNLLVGNLLPRQHPCLHETLQEWTKQYGKYYGFFEGGTPILTISDPDMLHEIFIKKFSHFHARKGLPIQPDPDKSKNVHMFLARGQRWKRLRMISNPIFSSSKIKAMMPETEAVVDELMKLLNEKCEKGESFDIYQMFQALTLDVIGRCAFGVSSDCQTNPNDEFLQLCKRVFVDTTKLNWLVALGIFLPELKKVWSIFALATDRIRNVPIAVLEMKLLNMVNAFRSTFSAKNCELSHNVNLLRLLLDTENNDFTIEENRQLQSWSDDGESRPKTDKRLLPEEVVSQSLLFFLAGYETTSTALAYASHLLATHPEVQEKLYEELQEKIPDQSQVTYDNVQKCAYLDQVISETLRLYPIGAPIQGRTCLQSCTIGGLHFPEGITVTADVWTIHNDPQLWGQDVDQFRPERFSPEESRDRHPMAWLPFGSGPRNCVGMRFALMEAKLTMIKLLKKFSIHTCPETEIPLKLQEGATITPVNGIVIQLKKRGEN